MRQRDRPARVAGEEVERLLRFGAGLVVREVVCLVVVIGMLFLVVQEGGESEERVEGDEAGGVGVEGGEVIVGEGEIQRASLKRC